MTAGWVLPASGWAILAVLAAHESWFAVRHLTCKPAYCSCPVTHKLLAGLPLHGHVVTDATYWRAAAKDLTQAKTVGPWLKLPGWKRRLARTGPVLAAAGVLINWWLAAAVLAVVAPFIAAAFSGRARRRLRRLTARIPGFLRLRHRDRVQTMGMLLSTITGTSSSTAEAGITWTPDYVNTQQGEVVARWKLPRGFKGTGGEKNLAQEVWQSRIAFALTFSWETQDTDEPELVIRRARQMRPVVYLHEVLDRLDALDDSRAGIGLDDQDGLGGWNWADENPHGVMNAGSRHGKTEINKCLVSQIIRKGGGVTYIDPKEISLQGMEGIPGLILRNDPGDIPAMWEAIADFRHLMDGRRIERARLGKDAVAGWNRQLLVLEEVNQFSEQSDDFWEELPEEEEGFLGTELWKPRRAKKTPRVWRHVKAVAWQGAAFKMHVFVDGQDVQATVLKGVRNSLGMRLLGAYQPSQWKFLVGTTPVPPAPNHKGRFCLVRGGEQTWLQAILADKDPDRSSAIWRDYAMGGRAAAGAAPPVSGPFTVTAAGEVCAGERVGYHDAKAVSGDLRGVKVSLAEAVDRGYAPGATVKALRMDRHRSDRDELPDGLKFPEPVREVASGGTERFWSSEIAEFNARRRGVRALCCP